MLRKSNLMPDTKDSFDGFKQLTRGHISFREDIAIINVTWAKNLQNRERLLEIPLFPIEGSALCPVMAIKLLLAKRGRKHDPLFSKGRKVCFTYAQFQRRFRSLLKRAGYKPGAFSSHSMRRGAPHLPTGVESQTL